MRVAVDATPLLEPMSGIPRYCRELFRALGGMPAPDRPDLQLMVLSVRGGVPDVPGAAPPRRRLPARALRAAWSRSPWPPAELLSGPVDVVHGTNFLCLPTRRAAPVVTVHDLAFLHRPETVRSASRAYAGLLRRAFARRPTVVLTPSRAVAAGVSEAFEVPSDRIVVTPLGVDAAAWGAPRGAGEGNRTPPGLDPPYVVFVGTREPRKNLATLLAAVRVALERGQRPPTLALVGADGWGDHAAAAQPGVQLLGRLSEDALRGVLTGAEAVLLPSLDEGFGLPVLEAAAAGRRVIASDIAVLHEVAAPDTTWVAPNDVDGWAAALVAVGDAGDRTLAEEERQVREADRRRHAAGFTWAACAAATTAGYRLARDLNGEA